MLVPHANSSVISLTSARELERTETTPFTTPTAFSSGRVRSVSISAGAAPSSVVRTLREG